MKLVDGRLSDRHLEFFQREGYLIVEEVFESQELDPLRYELAAGVEEKIQQLKGQGRIVNSYDELSFEERLVPIFRDEEKIGREIMYHLEGYMGGGYRGEEMFNLIKHPKMLRMVESIMGPEIISSSIYRLRTKLPGDRLKEVPWHQDSGYWAGQCDPHLLLTCWIPLVDANRQNGCLKILPRVHTNGVMEHYWHREKRGYLIIEDEDLPGRGQNAMYAQVKAGTVIILTNMTPHCSIPNTTDMVRWSVDLRYQSPEVPNNVGLIPSLNEEDDERNVELACYPPEADFIVQSERYPETVVTDFEQFYTLRKSYYDHYVKKTRDFPSPNRWKDQELAG